MNNIFLQSFMFKTDKLGRKQPCTSKVSLSCDCGNTGVCNNSGFKWLNKLKKAERDKIKKVCKAQIENGEDAKDELEYILKLEENDNNTSGIS